MKEEQVQVNQQQASGVSFKKLKQMAKKKGAKGGAGPNPNHNAFLVGLKGIQSTLVDIEFIETDYWLFAICAEQNS